MSGLRQYRFTKPANNGNSCGSQLVKVPGRKRIQMHDSDSDEAEDPQTLSVTEKESRLTKLMTLSDEKDTMVLQDSLLRANWNVAKAAELVNELAMTKRRKTNSYAKDFKNNARSTKSHRVRRDSNDEGSDSDNDRPAENVFDSDEEDNVEVGRRMQKQRMKVLDFINTGTQNDLLGIQSCTQRKVELLLAARPFRDWQDLLSKLQSKKISNMEILNNCQVLISRRDNLTKIMKKCNQIVHKLEKGIASGAGITSQPKNLNSEYKLAEYQIIGLNWLAVMHREETNGILADEMGLGKTIQVIAFLAYLKEMGLSRKLNLIIVPSSTLDNWDFELAKWCPSLAVAKYYGTVDERRALRIEWAKTKFAGIDVILTTYHVVASSPEERKMFRVSPIQYVIYDEAHMLKNMTTQRYGYLSRINAERRILLTGTPLQNNLLELISLLSFLMPSIFANKTDDIKCFFQKNVKLVKSENEEESTNLFEQSQIEQAKSIMKPFVLRRLKSEVLGYLPKKSEIVLKIPMSESQKVSYTRLVENFASEKQIFQSTALSGMTMMMDMRKLANHPLLLRNYYTDDHIMQISTRLSTDENYKGQNPDHIFDDLAILSDFQVFQLTQKYVTLKSGFPLPDELILNSGKFNRLDEILPKLKADGHRVLIFSQFTMMLDVMEEYLDIREYGYLRLDGQTAVTERQDLINQYNLESDIFIFLLSTRAGGLGINLTSADTVILHDIDFNPYNDRQAEDRCHRMGQQKPVTVYKFISEDTIEEGMLMAAKEKLNLEREVISNSVDEVHEHKCMVKMLSMALGLDAKKAEVLLSPSPKKPGPSLIHAGGSGENSNSNDNFDD